MDLIVKKLMNNHRIESDSLEEVLYESLSKEDYIQRNKEFRVGDIILTKYYSRRSNGMVSAHRVLIITKLSKGTDGVQYEGYPIKTDRGKSNKHEGGFPNSLSIKDYKTILVPGEDVPYPESYESYIDVQDLARFRSSDILPKGSSYAGHATDEFLRFVYQGVANYKNHKDNSKLHWDK